MQSVRVRFAPSPTGTPHIGNVRTALFNWLFARHHGGSFILRIEDTDRERLVIGSLEAILAGLRWLGLDWDEGPEVGGAYGPYFQSERLHLYREYARQLLDSGHAYHCYCSPQRLAAMRAEQERLKQGTGYDRHCRYLTAAQRAEYEASGTQPVMRFAMPLEGETTWQDELHGAVTVQNQLLDDFIALKSDGYPTYHFGVVVDDHQMEISHVLRADEWIPSTPRHILLYRALGWEPPKFVHLPIILGPDRSKLSKRHGATSITSYRDEGYLPEAIVNFLALLGWSWDGESEIFSREELVRRFDLDRVGTTAAVFNRDKLDWMNGYYIRQLSPSDAAERLFPVFQAAGLGSNYSPDVLRESLQLIAPLIQERMKRLTEAPALVDFLFSDQITYAAPLLLPKGLDVARTEVALAAALERLQAAPEWEAEALEADLRALADHLGMKPGQLFGALRVAVTGRTVAPPLFGTVVALGRERTLSRVREAVALLDGSVQQ
ncbi:MAG: glutamate--tRNA ligase [Chloroflexota bacterium]